jgi:hypothetical protein
MVNIPIVTTRPFSLSVNSEFLCFNCNFFFVPLWRMGPRCSSAETQVCHRSYIIAATPTLKWGWGQFKCSLAHVTTNRFFLSVINERFISLFVFFKYKTSQQGTGVNFTKSRKSKIILTTNLKCSTNFNQKFNQKLCIEERGAVVAVIVW